MKIKWIISKIFVILRHEPYLVIKILVFTGKKKKSLIVFQHLVWDLIIIFFIIITSIIIINCKKVRHIVKAM